MMFSFTGTAQEAEVEKPKRRDWFLNSIQSEQKIHSLQYNFIIPWMENCSVRK